MHFYDRCDSGMDLPTLNRDLWQLLQPEELIADAAVGANHQRSPAAIPYATGNKILKRGESALLMFRIQPTPDEMSPGMMGRIQRLWVAIAERVGDHYIGILGDHPAGGYANRDFYLSPGAEIPFLPHHIVDIGRPPFGFDINKILQTDPRRLWPRNAQTSPSIGDPDLDELLQLADKTAIRVLREAVFAAFGLGRTTGTTWSDRFIQTGRIETQDGSEAFTEAVQPLQERSRQNALLASAVCTARQIQQASGATYEAIVIFLENASGYSVYWIRTYRKTADGYEFDELIAQFGEPVVFSNLTLLPTTQANASHEVHPNAEEEAIYKQLNDCLAAQRWHDADQNALTHLAGQGDILASAASKRYHRYGCDRFDSKAAREREFDQKQADAAGLSLVEFYTLKEQERVAQFATSEERRRELKSLSTFQSGQRVQCIVTGWPYTGAIGTVERAVTKYFVTVVFEDGYRTIQSDSAFTLLAEDAAIANDALSNLNK